jgi:hypothetical protein
MALPAPIIIKFRYARRDSYEHYDLTYEEEFMSWVSNTPQFDGNSLRLTTIEDLKVVTPQMRSLENHPLPVMGRGVNCSRYVNYHVSFSAIEPEEIPQILTDYDEAYYDALTSWDLVMRCLTDALHDQMPTGHPVMRCVALADEPDQATPILIMCYIDILHDLYWGFLPPSSHNKELEQLVRVYTWIACRRTTSAARRDRKAAKMAMRIFLAHKPAVLPHEVLRDVCSYVVAM